MYEELRLNDEQFNTLKQLLVQRLVDKMTSKDLVRYITDDMSEEVYHTIFGGNFLFSVKKNAKVDKLVDDMSTKDLVEYVTNDMNKIVNKLSFTEVMESYWDNGLTEIIEKIKETH